MTSPSRCGPQAFQSERVAAVAAVGGQRAAQKEYRKDGSDIWHGMPILGFGLLAD